MFSHIIDFITSQGFTKANAWAILSVTGATTLIGLVFLQAILSADNALVIAMRVRHLPDAQQKAATRYGIWFAWIMLFVCLLAGKFLTHFLWIQIVAGAYLLYVAFKGLRSSESDDNKAYAAASFWKTVFAVEILDLGFSVDSILASLGVSQNTWILLIGGAAGVICMRFVAGIFISLIKSIPELEKTGFILVAIIGIKMIIEMCGVDIPNSLYYSVLGVIFLSTFVVHFFRKHEVGDIQKGA